MKKIILLSALALLAIAGCKEQMEEITNPIYTQLFSPVRLSASVANVTNAAIAWEKVDNAQRYVLELHKDPTLAQPAVRVDTTDEAAFSYSGLDEAVTYTVRVKAISDKVSESKWAVTTFETVPPPPPETTEWNFSDTAFDVIPTGTLATGESYTVNGLDVVAGTSTMTFATGSVSVETFTFTRWVQTGGAGNLTSRHLHLKVPKSGVLTVWTQSNGDAGRPCRVVDAAGTLLAEAATTASNASPISLNINVEANTDMYIYSGSGGIRFYTVILTVGGIPIPLDTTITLRSLAVTGETLTPAFDPDVTGYEVNVAKSVTAVTINAGKDHPQQTIEGDGEHFLTADSTVFPVKVTAEDSVSTRTYSITVKREKTASSDATLKTLTVSNGGALSPDFDHAVTEYTATVPYSVTRVTITGAASHKFAKVGNGGSIAAPAAPDTLTVGSNGPYSIVVMAEDNTMKTYTVTIVREAPIIEGGGGEDKWWNFSDAAFQSALATTFTADGYSIDDLQIIPGGSEMRYNENGKEMDGYTFTHRLQLNGTGDKTKRTLKFDVAGACTITVYMVTGSGSTVRPLIVHDGTDELTRLNTEGSGICKGTYSYNGDSGSIYLYSGDSGINLYGVKVEY
ncbi:MAG: cadherin-like beta sandwich domain-containing protein [Prevotellaceae bacterium]|jgi:hypothetical protein|nr:cadherin-like beta sandwich domain-containing protein [Prevotellaceae bacterium]